MLCQFCKKREATIHFTNVIGNEVEKIHICPECADEKGFEYLKKSNFEKGDLLAGLMDLATQAGSAAALARRCPGCGRTYEMFKKTGKLGCSGCYEFFEKELEPVLKSIHGNTGHVGKTPGRESRGIDRTKRLHELRAKLRLVIEMEEYERAAEIRDEINALKGASEEER